MPVSINFSTSLAWILSKGEETVPPRYLLITSIVLPIFVIIGICAVSYLLFCLFQNRYSYPTIRSPTTEKVKQQFDISMISLKAIESMKADEQGDLIDQYAKRGNSIERRLTQEQLNSMAIQSTASAVQLINSQEVGLGHCGRYAINNALQKELLTTEDFLYLSKAFFIEELGYCEDAAQQLIDDRENFGVSPATLSYILKRKLKLSTKCASIQDLYSANDSKQKALEAFISEANWAIIANAGTTVYDMPSATLAAYPLTTGHLVALHKDSTGHWWYIDSRAQKPVCIALAHIPKECLILAPIS